MPEPASAVAPAGRITLLTDFGTRDGYVAAVRGVIATLAPTARVEDATHEVEPGDVRGAAWVLEAYWRRYPPGTVHLIVVDPGVGGERRALAAFAEERYFVAPDNGVLTRVLSAVPFRAVELAHPSEGEISNTFHGRDLFAPVAAGLALGRPLDAFGAPIDEPVLLPLHPPVRGEGVVRGIVEHVDRFGNLITNVPGEWCVGAESVRMGGREIGPLRTRYVDVEPGEALALVGSAGLVEIAVRDGSAAGALGAGRDDEIDIQLSGARPTGVSFPASGGRRP